MLRGSVLAIGNFDGMHQGHRMIIDQAKACAQKLCAPLVVMTFHPHPRRFFSKATSNLAIEHVHQRLRHVRDLGVDGVYLAPFNQRLASMEAEDFITTILVQHLRVRHIMVGEDFCFGRGRRGTAALLKEYAAHHGFDVTCFAPLMQHDHIISSSLIRRYLTEGALDKVMDLLGRPYEIIGRVQHGTRIAGQQLGTPTANIALYGLHVPRYGVYAIRYAHHDSPTQWHDGVANLGVSPTFGGMITPRLEVHSFSDMGDAYGALLRVRLYEHIRDEKYFSSPTALKEQIVRDVEIAKASLAQLL
ncbi:MAG: riboflavin biosynthesis protein RibF [Alphaproteobacteria bacterium]|nr:MAG: riboflavin biosynthesis protein RibF [Alphaproteobacteria bacterium]TAF12997.1 MAG: riboflavin biosynthesis protein RibF [Alphaproteobacteria bacterium]TAF41928.1 MAG: riboflavin biosynthesis protein RibF [Alphaproteobacteria bacterium]TAF76769.1 MAG: riboflavin biosynthesis protein RibF [Alphaproteobacteria bacterium]